MTHVLDPSPAPGRPKRDLLTELPALTRPQAGGHLGVRARAAGANEYGQPVTVDFAQRVHLIVQGRTGSGKSRLSYGLRQQLAAPPDAIIAGSDPSSVLLQPFQDTRHAPLASFARGLAVTT